MLIAPMLITACWLFKFILSIWLAIGGFQLLPKGDLGRKKGLEPSLGEQR